MLKKTPIEASTLKLLTIAYHFVKYNNKEYDPSRVSEQGWQTTALKQKW